MITVIVLCLYAVIAFTMIKAGLDASDWQFWVISVTVATIDLLSNIAGRIIK